MTAGRTTVLRRIRQAALAQEGGPTDGELMERFTARRDADALEALIRRHGPMVLAVCHRVLGNEPDAEDAFQAAFLVFVRKAASIRSRELVGAWLYGVAYRTALKARGAAARRRMKERRAAIMNPTHADSDDGLMELLPLLDRELNRLPDKYRTALVLCELEGRPRKEAARKLGVPEGTLSSRLATAKRMLARRLGRQGPSPSDGALAAALGRSLGVPPPLLATTTKAAALFAAGQAATAVASARVAALAEGVLKTMLLVKLGVAVLAAVALVATGAAVLACRVSAAPPVALSPAGAPSAPADKPASDLTARIDAPKTVAADDPQLKGELVLTNDGEAPVRICTLANGNDGLGGAFGQHFRPDWWKSDRPPLEASAKKVVTLAPGKSVSFPFTINGIHFKDRDSFTITGFYAVEEKEFADKLDLWIGKAEAEPVKVRVGKEPEWGEAADGVQVRLRPGKTTSTAGETPEFTVDVRNHGAKSPYQCRVPNFCELEWDGDWYEYGGKGDLECKSTALAPGKEIDEWVKASLDLPWVRKGDREKRLQVAAGKHTVRIAVLFNGGPEPVSQPVDIEIGKESVWGEPDGGVQARIRVTNAAWDADQKPNFILDLRNQGKTTANARRVPFDCQIELDGTWYSYDLPSGPYPAVGDPLEPGKEIDNWTTASPDKNWGSLNRKKDHLPLSPGKHTIRVAYTLNGEKGTIRPVSGPIEIEVGLESAWGEAVGGVQARLRTPKAVWKEGEAPTLTLDLRTVGKAKAAALHADANLEIEADGAWYEDATADRLAKSFLDTDQLDLMEKTTDWLTVTADKRWTIKTPAAGKADHFPLPPGKHTIRLSYEVIAGGKTFRPVSGPVEIAVRPEEKEEAWGEAVDGVQARLRPSKTAWDQGKNPEFALDLRNRGKNTHALCRSPAYCRIEVDGKPYIQGAAAVVKYETTPLKPGDEVSGWLTFQPTFWFPRMPGGFPGTPNDEEECLTTSAGKHTMRAYLGFDVGDPPGVVPSQRVEFEVGKQSDWGKDDGGIQARVRTPKAVLVAMEAPTFRIDLRNVGDRTPHSLHIPFDCEIEVDGTWYYYNGPVDVTSQDTKLEPGKEYDNWVKVKPDGIRQEKAPKDRKPRLLLPLAPGKHTIRIAYPINSEKPPLRPVSGPIEIEVRKDSAGEQGADGKEEPQPLLKPTQGPGRVPFLPPDAPPPPRPSDPPSIP